MLIYCSILFELLIFETFQIFLIINEAERDIEKKYIKVK